MGKFTGKRVLITGGSSGIGLATAKLFASEGAQVIITGRDREKLELAKATLPGSAVCLVNDAGDIANIPSFFREISTIGKLDTMVLNAGFVQAGSLLDISSEQFDNAINVNVKSVFFSIQETVRQNLFASNATVVAVTGIINQGGREGFSVYAGTKAILSSLVKSLGLELIQSGIRFNAVSPGATDTPIFSSMGLPIEVMSAIRTEITGQTPIKRFAEAEEIARAIMFLSGCDSSYMVGSEIVIDGGTSIRI